MNKIDKILEKYFEGDTSIEEEKLLVQYFQKEKIDSIHEQYKPLFQFVALEKETIHATKIVPKPKTRNLYYYIAACASVAAIIFVTFNINKNPQIESMAYVNGKKVMDSETIHSEVLKAIISIEDDSDILESQIDLLDSFTQ